MSCMLFCECEGREEEARSWAEGGTCTLRYRYADAQPANTSHRSRFFCSALLKTSTRSRLLELKVLVLAPIPPLGPLLLLSLPIFTQSLCSALISQAVRGRGAVPR